MNQINDTFFNGSGLAVLYLKKLFNPRIPKRLLYQTNPNFIYCVKRFFKIFVILKTDLLTLEIICLAGREGSAFGDEEVTVLPATIISLCSANTSTVQSSIKRVVEPLFFTSIRYFDKIKEDI